jgi:hypothetical protein
MVNRHRRRVLAITVASPLTQNIYDRIGAEVISGYFDVVIIDCLEWVRQYDQKPAYIEMQSENIYRVDSESAFREVFRRTLPSFILDFVGRGEFTRKIQETCREFNALYITHLLTPFPNPISQKTLWRSFLSEPAATLNKVFRYILRQFLEDRPLPPDIALLAGSESSNAWTETAKNKIFTATPGYFELNRIQKSAVGNKIGIPGVPKEEYILFIDDCLAMSFDFVLGAHKPIVEPGEYFPVLKQFFSRLESRFKMPVVVAAHPNGKEFRGYKEYFGERTVLFDATAELSLGCHFAMTHYSSAITYPVLLRKPILLLNSRQLKKKPQGIAINYIAGLLQCPQVAIDEDLDNRELARFDVSSVNESCYKAYQEKYITNAVPNDNNPFEPLLNYLTSLSENT